MAAGQPPANLRPNGQKIFFDIKFWPFGQLSVAVWPVGRGQPAKKSFGRGQTPTLPIVPGIRNYILLNSKKILLIYDLLIYNNNLLHIYILIKIIKLAST